MSLWGRNSERLAQTAEMARAAGAKVSQRCCDMRETEAAIAALLSEDSSAPFDCAYLVAGLGDIRADADLVEDPALVMRLAEVNFAAPAAMAAAMAGRMAERGQGRIVLIGSAAGHHSLPFAAAYSGSKAGLARYADALRLSVKPHGVSVTLAAPGFIDTPAARAISGQRPLEMPVEVAALRIAKAALAGKRYHVTPWPFRVLRVVDALLPAAVRDRVLGSLKP